MDVLLIRRRRSTEQEHGDLRPAAMPNLSEQERNCPTCQPPF